MTVGQLVKLRGKTLRGKNRVARGGPFWLVVGTRRDEHGIVHTLLQSMSLGNREMFWVTPSDPNVEEVTQ